VRDVVTTLLEVCGFAAISAGAGAAVAAWSGPAGLAVGGVALIGSAVVIERPWERTPPVVVVDDGEAPL